MRPLLSLAAIAALTVTLGCAQGVGTAPPALTAQNPDSSYRPELVLLAGAEMQNVIARCRNKRLNGELKSFAESANCSNSMIVLAYGWLNYPYMDLVQALAASRLAVSERVDAGRLTEAEAQTQMAELGRQVNAEVLRRQRLTVDAPSRLARASSGNSQQALAAPVAAPGLEEHPIRSGVADLAGDLLLAHSLTIP
jgi:hypothetical protein